jgi:hypothetical protein
MSEPATVEGARLIRELGDWRQREAWSHVATLTPAEDGQLLQVRPGQP